MASVEEVRAAISQANEKAAESIAALQSAASALEDAQRAFSAAAEGSAQSEAEQINGLFAQALSNIGEVQNSVNAAVSTADSYSARL